MYYCPYCGMKVKEDEHFCMVCGRTIPNLDARGIEIKGNKSWFIAIITLLALFIINGGFAIYLNHKNTKAIEFYSEAEDLLLEEEYEKANRLLEDALDQRDDFTQAQVALQYTEEAIQIEDELEEAKQLLNDADFNESLAIIQGSEERMNRYEGDLVSILLDRLGEAQTIIKLDELQTKLEEDPSINEARILIWEAEEINHPNAREIATELRNQLVDYTFSKATEALNDKQFSDALLIVEDGLKYAPDDEKLQSLLANITKEKHSFESAAEQRMEQAIDTANKEHQMNENDAIELVDIEVESSNKEVAINGEVKSVATVPIHSIIVEYTLSRDDEDVLTNEIYVFPDSLYPTESGKFEFTHFDLTNGDSDWEAEVDRITWYTANE